MTFHLLSSPSCCQAAQEGVWGVEGWQRATARAVGGGAPPALHAAHRNLFLLRYNAVFSIITTTAHATLNAECESLKLLKPINIFNKSKGKVLATPCFYFKNIQLTVVRPRFKDLPPSNIIWFKIVLLFLFSFCPFPQGRPMLKYVFLVRNYWVWYCIEIQ